MFRGTVYLLIGWALIAIEGGLADVLGLTMMLPATSAIVVTHAAFRRGGEATSGLAVAIALGYLEDLHQGAPVGTLSLAHGLGFLGLRWSARRLHLPGWVLQSLASLLGVVIVDLVTCAVLLVFADAFGVRVEGLVGSLWAMRWHALATLLAAPPIWALLDIVFVKLRFDEEVALPSGRWGSP